MNAHQIIKETIEFTHHTASKVSHFNKSDYLVLLGRKEHRAMSIYPGQQYYQSDGPVVNDEINGYSVIRVDDDSLFAIVEKKMYRYTPDLKPCPFHERQHTLIHQSNGSDGRWAIHCTYCRTLGPVADTKDIAAQMWNKRS